MRIGFSLLQGELNATSGWVGGFYYIRNALNALASLPPGDVPDVLAFVPAAFREPLLWPDSVARAQWLRIVSLPDECLAPSGDRRRLQAMIDAHPFDVLFPLLTVPPAVFRARAIGWIPDFQHKLLPDYFDPQEREWRDCLFEFIVGFCDRIACSSEAVRTHLENFYPAAIGKGGLLPFVSVHAEEAYHGVPGSTVEGLGASGKYIYLPNQFWIHKNHRAVFEAWKVLRTSRHEARLVCTGWTEDYRRPGHYEELLRFVKEEGLGEKVTLLGFVDRREQLQLYRGAAAVLQPSLFEGWSTSIEDAKAFGKRLIVSDIPVHHEQCGKDAIYFDKRSPEDLARVITAHWESLPAGHDPGAEALGRAEAAQRTKAFGRDLIRLFESVTSAGDPQRREGTDLMLPLLVRSTPAPAATRETGVLRAALAASEADREARLALIHRLGATLAASEADREARLAVINRLSATLAASEADREARLAVINQLSEALASARARPAARFLRRPFGGALRLVSRRASEVRSSLKRRLAPKLGVLRQHPARRLEIPSSYARGYPASSLPTISLVTATYGQGGFIERTLRSVLDQGYPRLEYVVQDGGSRDRTLEILERYRPLLSHVESGLDGGQAGGLNRGFRRTTGEVMAYLNSDDLLLPGSLAYVGHFLAENRAVDVVYGHRVLIDEADDEIGRWVLPPHEDSVLSWADYVPQETLFWRRTLWDRVGGRLDETFRFALDWDLLLRFRDAGARFRRLPRFLGAFRVHEQQKTSAQMETIGILEMERLRERCHGRRVAPEEVVRHLRPYLRRHVVFHKLYRLGLLRY